MLRELLHEALAGARGEGSNGGHGVGGAGGAGAAPMVPPPPVAAVHRPSTWAAPAGDTEHVTIESDADLERFVHALLARAERDGEAIRAGRLRFALQRRGGAAPAGGAPRGVAPPGGAIVIERGAVTERTVEKAAKAGARLVLGAKAVPTPLAREKARALGIEFERER
jgi:hypothetical protein